MPVKVGYSRFNVKFSDEIRAWYQKEADDKDVSLSQMVYIAAAQYKDMIEGMRVIGNAKDQKNLIDQFEQKMFELQKILIDVKSID